MSLCSPIFDKEAASFRLHGLGAPRRKSLLDPWIPTV